MSSTPELSLHHGVQPGSRPTLIAFVSGNPQPNRSNITWYFNNQSLSSSILHSSILQDGNELLLPSNIGFDLAGRYTCQVTTSAGTASDDFLITVIREYLQYNDIVVSECTTTMPYLYYTVGQPAVVLFPMDSQLVVVNDSATVLTCSDSVGVPTPSFTWTYADNPINRIITGMLCYM